MAEVRVMDGAESGESNRGIQAVEDSLKQEDFPMDRHAVDYAVGDIEIEDGRGGYLPVRDLTDKFGTRQFESWEEVVRELKLAARRARKAA